MCGVCSIGEIVCVECVGVGVSTGMCAFVHQSAAWSAVVSMLLGVSSGMCAPAHQSLLMFGDGAFACSGVVVVVVGVHNIFCIFSMSSVIIVIFFSFSSSCGSIQFVICGNERFFQSSHITM